MSYWNLKAVGEKCVLLLHETLKVFFTGLPSEDSSLLLMQQVHDLLNRTQGKIKFARCFHCRKNSFSSCSVDFCSVLGDGK